MQFRNSYNSYKTTIVPIGIKANVPIENIISMNMTKWHLPSLIPFMVYLVNNPSCRDSTPENWKHGPEFTFHVDVNSSMLMPDSGNYLCSNVTISLNCRSFPQILDGPQGHQCYVKNAQITNYKVFMSNGSREIVKDDDKATSEFEIGANKFEIVYDKNGITEFRYEPPLSQWRLNMLRAVANQLNIGFALNCSLVTGNGNSTIGECETEWRVTKVPSNLGRSWNSTECGIKELFLTTEGFSDENVTMTIESTRFTNKCSKSTPYVFGAKEVMKDVPASENMKMTSSVTSFVIGLHYFRAQTKNTAAEEKMNSTMLISYEETIDLSLLNIKPAEDEFKMISNPVITTIFAYAPTIKAEKTD